MLVLNGRCTNIPHVLNDKISSIDPSGKCIEIFLHRHCRGPSVQISGDPINDLNELGFNDKMSSIKLCGSFEFRNFWGFHKKRYPILLSSHKPICNRNKNRRRQDYMQSPDSIRFIE